LNVEQFIAALNVGIEAGNHKGRSVIWPANC
jgi:hypothetical protein